MTAAEKAFITLAIVVAGFLGFMWLTQAPVALGSNIQGNDYIATSTAANGSLGAFTTTRVLKTGQGSLAQYNITGANTGIVNFYNATTTSVLLRTGAKATSTILIASFPASTAAGTYMFDAEYTDGLLIEITGSAPTSTVSYR